MEVNMPIIGDDVIGSSTEQQQRITNIHKKYLTDISSFITTLETIDNQYPVEITNEIRATFTHISRCYTFPTKVDIDAQITAAERHIKRAMLDCYKYACLSHAKTIKAFWEKHKYIDLTYVDQGEFIKELDKKTQMAQDRINTAKKIDTYNVVIDEDLELKVTDDEFEMYCRSICDDDLFALYEDAYQIYSECVDLIKRKYDAINFLVKKATLKDRLTVASFIFGIVGVLVGIIGIVINFI